MLKAHPELKAYCRPHASTYLWILPVVVLQFGLAWLLRDQPWWLMLGVCYVVGAPANHAMFVMIHEATHNLIFRTTRDNLLAGMTANLPVIVPAAVGFRKFHLLHHKYQGDLDMDADLPGPLEAKIVGNRTVMKILWLLVFAFVEGGVRPNRLKRVRYWDMWFTSNFLVQMGVIAAVWYWMGGQALLYLTLSTFFAVGLHPLGARWVQEHYVFKKGQETYSYYGPANNLAFHVGCHNEHHDIMTMPWMHLPKMRKIAPEYYKNLLHHKSYTKLLLKFLFDPAVSLYDRVIRKGTVKGTV